MPRVTKEQRAQLLEFAQRFHELMRQWEAAHPYDTFKVDPKLSRILALVPEYDSGRVRKKAPVRGPAQAPTIFTILELAERLGVPICALFPAADHVAFGHPQIDLVARMLRSALSIIAPPAATRVSDFADAVPFETLQKPAYDFAAGVDGIDGDFAPEPHDVFRGISGIETQRLQVVRVTSDSMSPLLLTGDRVLIDTSRTRPRESDVVGVVSERHGRLVGYWHVAEKQCFLRKENRDYRTVVLGTGDWRVVGTITGFVDAPLRPQERLQRRSLGQ
jgi:hypothetical protein